METDYSDLSKLRPAIHVADIGREGTAVHHIIGSDNQKKGNLHFIDSNVIMYVSGNAVIFNNLVSDSREILLGMDQSVGCTAVHPSRKYFAVGCVGNHPKIYVYSYPEMKIVKILKGGAEKGYATMAFNRTGQRLASVAMSPDYMLTIWDWEDEKMGLHSKAFGQDIINVQFSLDDDYRLTTSGSGHIRFWKIASTFTGLKLQGLIGKFGKVELSDINSFTEFPDGKVLSGTEFGSILLWEGNFIKCRFTLPDGQNCHDGEITFVKFDREEKCIITAGVDGFIKWWDFSTMDTAEIDSDNSMDFEITPIAEFKVKDGIVSMIDRGNERNTRKFVFKTNNGSIKSCTFDLRAKGTSVVSLLSAATSPTDSNTSAQFTPPVETSVINGHVGSITGLDTCPCGPYAASCDSFGNIILWDYVRKREVTRRNFNHVKTTCLAWLPKECCGSAVGASFAVGFEDGVVRVLTVAIHPSQGIILTLGLVIKPHDSAVLNISFSHGSRHVSTCARDGTLFLFDCGAFDLTSETIRWIPIRFISLVDEVSTSNEQGKNQAKNIYCESMSWSYDGHKILCSCNDSILREVNVTDILSMDTTYLETYKVSTSVKEYHLRSQVNENAATSKDTGALAHQQSLQIGSLESGKSQVLANQPGSGNVRNSKNANESANYSTMGSCVVLQSSLGIYALNNEGVLTNSFVQAEPNQCSLFRTASEFSDELPSGSFSKSQSITCMKYSWTNNLFVQGGNDGSVVIRPSSYLDTFVRSTCHSTSNNSSNSGTRAVALTYDDKYVLSGGSDGIIVVQRVRLDMLLSDIPLNLHKDIQSGVYDNLENSMKFPYVVDPKYVEPSYLRLIRSFESVEDSFPSFPTGNDQESTILSSVSVDVVQDFDGASKYSVQEDRLRRGEDIRLEVAEGIKAKTRQRIRELQKKYIYLRRQNDALPEAVRLPREKLMEIDGDYWELLLHDRQSKIEEVHKSYAFEMEKSIVLRNKIGDKLMKGIIVEESKLEAFPSFYDELSQSPPVHKFSDALLPYVLSLRAQALDKKVTDILDSYRKSIGDNNSTVTETRNDASDQGSVTLNAGASNDINLDQTSQITNINDHKPDDTQQSNHNRTELRKQRLENIKIHESKKPKEDEDDIRDIEAIRRAEETLGNYKLKFGDDYEITEQNRVNAPKKRIEMALLEEDMLVSRLKFDEKFLKLRKQKYDTILEIQKHNQRIRVINHLLNEDGYSNGLWEPQHNSKEYPDDRVEVTVDELQEYRRLRGYENKTDSLQSSNNVKPWLSVEAPAHTTISGKNTNIPKDESGAYILQCPSPKTVDVEELRNVEYSLVRTKSSSSSSNTLDTSNELTEDLNKKHFEVDDRVFKSFYQSDLFTDNDRKKMIYIESIMPHLKFIKETKKLQVINHNRSALIIHGKAPQETAISHTNKLLRIERSKLLKIIKDKLENFNHSIKELAVERHELISTLKLKELRLLVLHQEYQLLLTFEDRDSTLQVRQQRCKGEQDEISACMAELKAKLDSKTEDLLLWQGKLATLQSELKATLPESHPHHDILTRIFKKKIKRGKSLVNGSLDSGSINDPSTEEDIEEDLDDDDEDDDDDDDELDEVEDICPAGCEIVLYDRIIDLREKRLTIDEAISETSKVIEDYRKSYERFKQREKQIIKDVQQANVEVKQFHLQKQAALNQIEVVVPIKMSQIFAFEGSGIFTKPSDSNSSIDVPETSIENENGNVNSLNSLKDFSKRKLVTSIDPETHVLFRKSDLLRLDERIRELHIEYDESSSSLKELHKERVRLNRESESKGEEIAQLEAKCTDLQMLKFGRKIQLSELEAGADRPKEQEAEEAIKVLEQQHRKEQAKIMKEIETLQEQLAQATVRNTEVLTKVGDLTKEKLLLTRDLNQTSTSIADEILPAENYRDREEQARLTAYIKAQVEEMQALRSEISILKRKDIPPVAMSSLLPNPPPIAPENITLPPIKDAVPLK